MNEITEKNIRYGLTFESKAKGTSDCLLSEGCLFCNRTEKNYKTGPDVDFICGTCVQLLLWADHEDLKKAHAKALALGYLRKVSAIETFLKPEGHDEQRKPESKLDRRHFHRRGSLKAIRNKKERIGRI